MGGCQGRTRCYGRVFPIRTDQNWFQLLKQSLSRPSSHARSLAKYGDAIQTVSDFVGAATVSELERLSTALYVIEEEDAKGDDAVSRITVLKPHVSREQAKTAIARIEELIQGSFSRLADSKHGE